MPLVLKARSLVKKKDFILYSLAGTGSTTIQRIPKDQETSQGKIAYDPVVRKKILFVNLDQAKKLMPGFEEVYNLKNKREPSREFESKIWPSDFLDDRDDGSFNEQLDRERVWPQLNPKIM